MKKRKIRVTTLIIILVAAFMVLINGAIGTFFTFKSVNDMKNLIQGKMLDLASSAALMLDGDDLKDLTENDYTNKTQRYLDAYETLDKFKTSSTRNNAEFAYIYLLKQVDETSFIFTVDVDDEAPAAYGRETIYTEALASAGKGIAAFDDKAYVDEWGEYYSAYAPVFTSNNEVAAIVAVDCNASWYKNEIISNVWSIGVITILSTIISVALALVINSRTRRKFNILLNDTNNLQNDVNSLINSIQMPKEFLIEENNEHKDDDIGELRERVNLIQKEIRHYLEYTQALAYMDRLTGMGNRTSYIERLNTFNKDTNPNKKLTVVVFDINGLKTINDTYGHDVGDKSIIESGTQIINVFGSKVSYRIGGDEMAVLIENDSDADIKELLHRFDENLVIFNNRHELPFDLALAKGYAIYDPEKDKSFKDVFNRADGSMYQNKNNYYDLDESK